MYGILSCLGVSICFVALLYVWNTFGADRNDPHEILRRTISCLLSCIIAVLPVMKLAEGSVAIPQGKDLSWLLGMRPDGGFELITSPLLHVTILYMGTIPIYMKAGWSYLFPSVNFYRNMRNLIIAPITEEWVFRACLIALLEIDGYSPSVTIILAPLFFGIAHLHHYFSEQRRFGQNFKGAIQQEILLATMMQFTYTTLFGWYAAYIFVTTRCIVSCILLHMLCNFMGLPPLHLLSAGSRPDVGPREASRHRYYMIFGIIAFIKTWNFLLLGAPLHLLSTNDLSKAAENFTKLLERRARAGTVGGY